MAWLKLNAASQQATRHAPLACAAVNLAIAEIRRIIVAVAVATTNIRIAMLMAPVMAIAHHEMMGDVFVPLAVRVLFQKHVFCNKHVSKGPITFVIRPFARHKKKSNPFTCIFI